MHELSIAMSIVEMAEEEAAQRGNVKVQSVHLQLGALSGVVKEALLSCYEMACASTVLEGSQLLIEDVPVEVFCRACHSRRRIQSIQWLCCPVCAEPASEVLQGKELMVVALGICDPGESSEEPHR